jgi:RNA polymerase sigma-70 factor (ECF subfamily)
MVDAADDPPPPRPVRDDEEDETLMLRYARDADAGAFALLYGRHRVRLHRYLVRMCGDTGRAEEVFQDAWLQVIGARERWRPEARFTTWLWQIARNRMLDVLRRDGRAGPSLDAPEGEGLAATLAAPDTQTPARLVERARLAADLVAAVDALPPEQREAFLLHEDGELTLEEIAALTGVGRETVKSRLRYALRKLRERLGAQVEVAG